MILCACCNPPDVDEPIVAKNEGLSLVSEIDNGFLVPNNFPVHKVGEHFEATPEGVRLLEKAGFTFKYLEGTRTIWWHTPEGEPVFGIIPFGFD